jgi:hypothetical protein
MKKRQELSVHNKIMPPSHLYFRLYLLLRSLFEVYIVPFDVLNLLFDFFQQFPLESFAVQLFCSCGSLQLCGYCGEFNGYWDDEHECDDDKYWLYSPVYGYIHESCGYAGNLPFNYGDQVRPCSFRVPEHPCICCYCGYANLGKKGYEYIDDYEVREYGGFICPCSDWSHELSYPEQCDEWTCNYPEWTCCRVKDAQCIRHYAQRDDGVSQLYIFLVCDVCADSGVDSEYYHADIFEPRSSGWFPGNRLHVGRHEDFFKDACYYSRPDAVVPDQYKS